MRSERKYCTFYVADRFFGVSVDRVQEVLRFHELTRVPRAPEFVRGLINLRGQIVTAIDIRHRLGLEPRENERELMNVVVRTEEGAVSLLVDEIDEVVELDESAFEPAPENLSASTKKLVRGVHKFEDRLMLELDPEAAIDFVPERVDKGNTIRVRSMNSSEGTE